MPYCAPSHATHSNFLVVLLGIQNGLQQQLGWGAGSKREAGQSLYVVSMLGNRQEEQIEFVRSCPTNRREARNIWKES